MDTETELASLRATVAALSQQVEALTAPAAPTAATADTAAPTATAAPSAEPRSTRRGALRLLGAAAAGGAAALVAGQPAAADNGISLLGSNNTTDNWTRVDFVSTVPGGTAFMFQAGNTLSPGTLGGKPAALGGVSTSGLHARHANGGTGLLAEANSFGWAINATSVSSFSIVASSQDSTGISANGGLYGALLAGSRAALRLTPSGVSGPPSAALSHNPGELDADLDGDLDCLLINNSPLPFSSLNYGSMRDASVDQWKVNEELKGGGNPLYRNEHNFFTEVTKEAGLHTGLISFGLGVSIGDLNNDGYPDIYVGNDFIGLWANITNMCRHAVDFLKIKKEEIN